MKVYVLVDKDTYGFWGVAAIIKKKEGINMTREDFIDQMVKEYSDKYVTYVGSREEIEKINMRALCEIIYNSQFFIDKGIEKLIRENKMIGGIGYADKICDMY